MFLNDHLSFSKEISWQLYMICIYHIVFYLFHFPLYYWNLCHGPALTWRQALGNHSTGGNCKWHVPSRRGQYSPWMLHQHQNFMRTMKLKIQGPHVYRLFQNPEIYSHVTWFYEIYESKKVSPQLVKSSVFLLPDSPLCSMLSPQALLGWNEDTFRSRSVPCAVKLRPALPV